MIELHISMTGKRASRDEYRIFAEDVKRFADMAEARAWMKKQYGTSKRQPMYRDRKDGTPIKCGYIIGFRNADYSHAPVERWYQQDWVEFRECGPIDIDRK